MREKRCKEEKKKCLSASMHVAKSTWNLKRILEKKSINIDITDAEDRFQASLLCTMMTRKEHLPLPILENEISREIY